ncbi:MAG: hypothetical protein QM765_35515 [Myxococcales bacterium]
MRRAGLHTALAAALAVSAACQDPAPVPLAVRSVTPAQSSATVPVALVIAGEGFEPGIWTDFRRQSGSTLRTGFSARLVAASDGTVVELTDVLLSADKTLAATVPAGLARGEYDLQVTDPRQATASLPQAFRVVTSAEDVAAFRIDLGAEQRVQVPFLVSLTAVDAQGRTVDGFDGTVTLSDETNTVAPQTVGPFVLGRAQATVAIGAIAAQDRITVRDSLGHSSTSEPFAVAPGLAVKIAFVSAPAAVAAGTCSAAVDLELRDGFDLPAPAQAQVAVALSAGIADEVGFFSDAGCASPLAQLDLAAGQARGTFHFLTTRAGAPVLRAAPATLPSATQAQTVSPLSPTRLAFGSAPQSVKVGACSASASLQAQDVYGNQSPVPAEVVVDLRSTPAAGFTFHGDGACGAAASTVTIAAGASQALFTFRAASAGDYHVEAAAQAPSTLTAAVQDESVSE